MAVTNATWRPGQALQILGIYEDSVVFWFDNRVHPMITLIVWFMGPTWGPSGANRAQVGPILAPWTLLSGNTLISSWAHVYPPRPCLNIKTIFPGVSIIKIRWLSEHIIFMMGIPILVWWHTWMETTLEFLHKGQYIVLHNYLSQSILINKTFSFALVDFQNEHNSLALPQLCY